MRSNGSTTATNTGGVTGQEIKNLYSGKASPDSTIAEDETALIKHEMIDEVGSNGFALAPSKTTSKNAILYINPHVTFYYRLEVHMVRDEGLNAYGAVTWGKFLVFQGFNQHCG